MRTRSVAIYVLAMSTLLGFVGENTTTDSIDNRWLGEGGTAADLLELRGEPRRTYNRREGDRVFRTYEYADETSYVVDLSTGLVCDQGIGESPGYCYPCDYGPSAGTCP